METHFGDPDGTSDNDMLQNARMNRMFAPDGKCFDVAIDHGVFHNAEFLAGIENLAAAVATLVEAAPDAIQLGVGQCRFLQAVRGRNKPALVMRADVANVYGPNLPPQLFCMTVGNPVEQALRADAAALVLNLFHAPDQPELYRQCIANIAAVKPEFGLMECLAMLELSRSTQLRSLSASIRVQFRWFVASRASFPKIDPFRAES